MRINLRRFAEFVLNNVRKGIDMRNILVEYKGGGYDGCFWEWNYCVVDKSGKFHDIHSSGYAGIESKTQLITRMTSTDETLGKSFYIYNLSNPADLENFAKNSNPDNVTHVKKWFDIGLNIDLPIFCNECECEIEFQEDIIEGDQLFCSSCHGSASCCYCGEFYGWDYEFNDDGFCEYCAEGLESQAIANMTTEDRTEYDNWVGKHNASVS